MKDATEDIKVDGKIVKEVKALADKLFELLGLDAKIEVSADKDNNTVLVNIDSPNETGLLIGKRGETLHSIQSVLALMTRTKVDGWIRIIVDVGDWREKNEEYLKDLAEQTAQRAKETSQPQNLYNLNSAQRRIIHMYLSEDKDIETESLGEGQERYLVVKIATK
jgi:spoIIIJ-associated protein